MNTKAWETDDIKSVDGISDDSINHSIEILDIFKVISSS